MAKKEILNNDAVTIRVGEAAGEVIDSVVDAAETVASEVADTVERVVTVTKSNPYVLAGVALAAAGLGAFVAYKLTQRHLSKQFDEELREQIAAARSFTRRMAKEGELESPESAVKALVPEEVVEVVRAYRGEPKVPYHKPETIETIDPRPPVEVVVEKVEITKNIFTEARIDPRDWDYNAEIADRELHPDIPYVISFEEFNENAPGHEQINMTYYAKDDTLADSQEKPVDNTDYTVGNDSFTRFGHGSGDPHVVYVRNEKLDLDIEIVRSNGSYEMEVLGTDSSNELKHSRRQARRSWRADE